MWVANLISGITGPVTLPERVLGVAEANTASDAIAQKCAVEPLESASGEGDILELDERHRTVLWLLPAQQPFPARRLAEDLLELLLDRTMREVANVQSIAWRILVSRIVGRELLVLIVVKAVVLVGVTI